MLHPNRLSPPCRKAHLLEDKQIPGVGVFDEDKNATLQDFDEALDLQYVETASQSLLTPSMIEGDGVTTICDDVKVADLKNPMEDSAG
ncbi:hypothetical protein Tco_0276379 [Tanacetum coccineum]